MKKKENIWNVPNSLTFFRLILTFLAIYFIIADFHIILIISVFILGMFTDLFDGMIARKLNQTTEFGRQFDMVADRIMIMGVGVIFIIKSGIVGILTGSHYFQLIFMLIREILTTPVALITMLMGGGVPQVRNIGKATTFLQSVTFPAILLSIYYGFFGFSLYLAIFTGIIGLIASYYYINDKKFTIKRL